MKSQDEMVNGPTLIAPDKIGERKIIRMELYGICYLDLTDWPNISVHFTIYVSMGPLFESIFPSFNSCSFSAFDTIFWFIRIPHP